MLLAYTLNRYLWAELMFNQLLKMLGEIKRFILNVNLKNIRHVQHFVIDLKMELLVKIVIDFNVKIIFLKKIDLICVTGSEFASD